MKKRLTAVADILIYLLADIAGWAAVILFDLTGEDCKFQDPALHLTALVIGAILIFAGIICGVMFFTKERTKYRLRIGKGLLGFDLIMTLAPFVYLGLTYLFA